MWLLPGGVCISCLEIASSFQMNLKNRAWTVVASVALYNLLAFWLLSQGEDLAKNQLLWLVGMAMGFNGFGFLYRTNGYFASPYARYQKVAFGAWFVSIAMGFLHIPGGIWLIFGALALVLVQYGRYFLYMAQRELRDFLGLFLVIAACVLPVFLQFDWISSPTFWWIVSGLLALVAVEFLVGKRYQDASTFHNRGQSPVELKENPSDNPFDRPS
jgi:hypothetical protein